MLTETIMTVGVYIFSIGIALVNAILSPLLSIANVPYNGAVGASYIFGNLGLFNSVLPVAELIFFVVTALTLKGFVFGFKVFWAITSWGSAFMKRFVKFSA